MTGDVAVTCYWIWYKWLDKDGKGAAHTLRITHTWPKNGNDWRIIGGMSMPEPTSTQTETDSTSAPTAQTEVLRVARLGMLSDLESFGNPLSPSDWLSSFRAVLRDSG